MNTVDSIQQNTDTISNLIAVTMGADGAEPNLIPVSINGNHIVGVLSNINVKSLTDNDAQSSIETVEVTLEIKYIAVVKRS
jgi:hypothetical protein